MARGWYVVHTYTGYEQKIERIINKLRASDGEFDAYCTGVNVPMETVTVQNEKGETKTEHKKVIPGYILVELDLPENNTWRMVTAKIARIQGVTGFLTADKSGQVPPKPLSAKEHSDILRRTGEMPEEKIFRPKQDFLVGEQVKVISGPFASFDGTIDEIDLAKGRMRLSVQIFGRSTPVEVDFSQVEKVLP